MKPKSIILLTILFIIICFSIIVVILLLTTFNKKAVVIEVDDTPISNPVSFAPEIPNDPIANFEIAAITNKDTINILDKKDNEVIINLEQKSWKNIQISPDSKMISVLGLSAESIYDLYIYDVGAKSWSKVTNFESQGSGVESYLWLDNSSLLFIQGVNPERWLHSYKIRQQEVKKLSKVEGQIYQLSAKKDKLIFQTSKDNNFEYYVTTSEGQKIYSFTNLKEGSTTVSKFKNVSFTADENVIFLTTEDKYYYSLFGSRELIPIESSVRGDFLCTNTKGIPLISILNLDSAPFTLAIQEFYQDEFINFYQTEIESEPENIYCAFDKLIYAINTSTELKWFIIDPQAQIAKELTSIKNYIEITTK